MAVHGTRNRESVSWDYAVVLQVLKNVAREHTGLPLLRCYWYEATVEGSRSDEHNTFADLPGVKLRLGRLRPGRIRPRRSLTPGRSARVSCSSLRRPSAGVSYQ